MNYRSFVGNFGEISHLSAEEQADLLGQARYHAFSSLGLSSLSALYFTICLLVGFILALACSFLFGFNTLLSAVCIGLGIMVSIYLYRLFYRRLLHKGLVYVLQK